MKLTKEDIKKYGTEDEKVLLKEDIESDVPYNNTDYDTGYKDGYQDGYAACKEEWEQSELEQSEWE